MIDFIETLEELKGRIALSCNQEMDARALIFAADNAARSSAPAVSCSLDSVNMLWTWLEKSNIKIFARVIADEFDCDVQKIAAAIHNAFKKGANGVHLVATPSVHEKLANALAPIVADLFFGRELIITMNLQDITPSDCVGIFQNLQKIGASGLGLIVDGGEDTTATFYGVIDSADSDFQGSLHIISKDSDMQIIENIWRITKKMRPELNLGTIFFIEK